MKKNLIALSGLLTLAFAGAITIPAPAPLPFSAQGVVNQGAVNQGSAGLTQAGSSAQGVAPYVVSALPGRIMTFSVTAPDLTELVIHELPAGWHMSINSDGQLHLVNVYLPPSADLTAQACARVTTQFRTALLCVRPSTQAERNIFSVYVP